MGDLHEMIVHNIRKMVGRKAISFHKHKVLFGLLLLKGAIDSILELCGVPKRPEFSRTT